MRLEFFPIWVDPHVRRLMVSSLSNQKPLSPSDLNCHKYVHEIILLNPNAQQHGGQGDRKGRRLGEVVSLYAHRHVLKKMPRP